MKLNISYTLMINRFDVISITYYRWWNFLAKNTILKSSG